MRSTAARPPSSTSARSCSSPCVLAAAATAVAAPGVPRRRRGQAAARPVHRRRRHLLGRGRRRAGPRAVRVCPTAATASAGGDARRRPARPRRVADLVERRSDGTFRISRSKGYELAGDARRRRLRRPAVRASASTARSARAFAPGRGRGRWTRGASARVDDAARRRPATRSSTALPAARRPASTSVSIEARRRRHGGRDLRGEDVGIDAVDGGVGRRPSSACAPTPTARGPSTTPWATRRSSTRRCSPASDVERDRHARRVARDRAAAAHPPRRAVRRATRRRRSSSPASALATPADRSPPPARSSSAASSASPRSRYVAVMIGRARLGRAPPLRGGPRGLRHRRRRQARRRARLRHRTRLDRPPTRRCRGPAPRRRRPRGLPRGGVVARATSLRRTDAAPSSVQANRVDPSPLSGAGSTRLAVTGDISPWFAVRRRFAVARGTEAKLPPPSLPTGAASAPASARTELNAAHSGNHRERRPHPALGSATRAVPGRRAHPGRARADRAARDEPRPAGVRAGQPAGDGEGRAVRPLLALPGHAAAPVPRRVRRLAAGDRRRRPTTATEGKRAAELYERIFVGYGDDSRRPARRRARRRGVVLERPHQDPAAPAAGRLPRAVARATSPTTSEMAPGGGYRYYRDERLGPGVRGGDGLPVLRPTPTRCRACARGWTRRSRARTGESPAARNRAVNAKALDLLRGLLPAASLQPHGHLRDRPDLRAADPAPDRPPAAGGAPLRRADPRRDQGRHAELRRPRRAPRPRRRVGHLPRAAPRRRPSGGPPASASTAPTRTATTARPSTLLHVDGDEEQLLAALLFEAGRRLGGARPRRRRRACPTTSAPQALSRPRRRPPQPPPPPRPRLRGAALPLRDRLGLRRVPRPPAPPHAHRPVAGAVARPRRRRPGGGRRRRRRRRVRPRAGPLARPSTTASPAPASLDAAPYALCLGYRIRYVLDLNAREAMHLVELRSGREGHPDLPRRRPRDAPPDLRGPPRRRRGDDARRPRARAPAGAHPLRDAHRGPPARRGP